MSVTIGIDPHKSTHTAVAVDRDEHQIARLTIVADRHQTTRLLAWAEPLDVLSTEGPISAPQRLGKLPLDTKRLRSVAVRHACMRHEYALRVMRRLY